MVPQAWPFKDPPNTAAITTADVLDRHMPILLVFCNLDDGGFQFHSANGAPADLAEARVVGLGTMLALDPTLAAVPDLRPGGRAHRPSEVAPWSKTEPPVAPTPTRRRFRR